MRDPRLDTDSDFIDAPKYGNSLRKLLERYPDGVPDSVICKVMRLESKTMKSILEAALEKLRKQLRREGDD